MKSKVNCLLVLCSALVLSNVNAADKKAPTKVKAFVSCAGATQFFYGFTYFAFQRVIFNGQLYQATRTNSSQWPGTSSAWVWLGPCN
jgi:hypothetical protein